MAGSTGGLLTDGQGWCQPRLPDPQASHTGPAAQPRSTPAFTLGDMLLAGALAHPTFKSTLVPFHTHARAPMTLLAAYNCSHLHCPAALVLAAESPLQLLQLLLVAGSQAVPLASASSQVTASRSQLHLQRAEVAEIHTAAWQWCSGQEGCSQLSRGCTTLQQHWLLQTFMPPLPKLTDTQCNCTISSIQSSPCVLCQHLSSSAFPSAAHSICRHQYRSPHLTNLVVTLLSYIWPAYLTHLSGYTKPSAQWKPAQQNQKQPGQQHHCL